MRQVTGRLHLPSIYNSGEGKQLAAPTVSFDKRSYYGTELRNEKNEIVVRGTCPARTDSPQYIVGRWRSRPSSPRRPPSPWPSPPPRRRMGWVWPGAGNGDTGFRFRFHGQSTVLSAFVWLSVCRVWSELWISGELRLRPGRPGRGTAISATHLYPAGGRASAAACAGNLLAGDELLALLPEAGRLLSVR